jgi:hypothetical protein
MLHPEAQRSEHRTKTLAPTKALPQQEPAIPTFGNQAASKALNPSTTQAPPSHWHTLIIPQNGTRQKNLNSPSGLVGEDHLALPSFQSTKMRTKLDARLSHEQYKKINHWRYRRLSLAGHCALCSFLAPEYTIY